MPMTIEQVKILLADVLINQREADLRNAELQVRNAGLEAVIEKLKREAEATDKQT